MSKSLPPLPRSDGYAIERNSYDGYYGIKSRDFWGANEIIREEVKPFKKCEHSFHATASGFECEKCHMGLMGPGLSVQEGKLFYKGEPIAL